MNTRHVTIALAVTIAAIACEDRIIQPVIVALKPEGNAGATGTAGASSCATAHTPPPPTCQGMCCPMAMECYPFGNPSMGSGAECLAQHDNTGQTRLQLRQTFSVSLNPPGLAATAVATLLLRRSELKSASCGAPTGTGGFMQLIDFDRTMNTSRTGFARYAADLPSALASDLCFVEEPAFSDPMYELSSLYAPPAGWPGGLPAPMPQPWNVKPVTAVRVDKDFSVSTDRATILARFDTGGDLAGKASGIFFFDDQTGYMHGYSPVTFIVNYDSPTQYVVVPIREAEITQQLNDPFHPNCSGVLVGDNLPTNCVGDATTRAWGCPAGNCTADQLTPTKIEGYFLIAEIEQVSTLGQTLCNLFTSGKYPGWTIPADNQSCRADPQWNPADPVHGLPKGDWCATTNHAADDNCHDALKSLSYSTFQGFKINDGTCPAL